MPRRKGSMKGIALLPNLLTTSNLFCGFFSITMSIQGRYVFAGWLIILATFFDFLDGRVARMTNTQSDFGVEYDSLSDLTTFCMAPAVLIYTWSAIDFNRLGLAACFLYFCCGALRLARFNVQSGSVEKVNFQGLPSPAAGGTLASLVIFWNEIMGPERFPSLSVLGLTILLGLLMVSHVEYKSFKKVKRASFLFLVFMAGILFVIAAQPEIMLFVFGISYITLGIVRWLMQSPEKIRGIRDLLVRVYNHRRENLLYDDDDDDDISENTKAGGNVISIE